MELKLRQVTDNIHGTIYLSELESELISTPFFYRLHDIYQSSTVYMTFPSNRTKRYEHSLGTMALASKMFYSSLTNADSSTKDCFFSEITKYFKKIVEEIINNRQCERIYFNSNENVNRVFSCNGDSLDYKSVLNTIIKSVKSGGYVDKALDYYQYCPIERFGKTKDLDAVNVFLYKCFLQAIRIVALFHDVGHPPYSHIIESTLIDIFNTIKKEEEKEKEKEKEKGKGKGKEEVIEEEKLPPLISKKVEDFKQCLGPFISIDPGVPFECDRLLCKSSLSSAATHERIGLSFLSYAIDDVVPEIIIYIANNVNDRDSSISHIVYYITVVEFAFAILCEENKFFESFHRIVDGPLDSDRLDYIVRDSQNSGVDWGTIPYERIVNSAKLFRLEKNNRGERLEDNKRPFVIAYPQKIVDDIEDLLLVRYKIFARINYHHRCVKTSMALQEAVRELTIDYLKNANNKNCINPDIHILWTALSQKTGDKRIRVIQWNDSWLISAMHKALIELHSRNIKTSRLKENLEEILLNKKKYYSLMKRGRDNISFVKMILEKANISKELTDKMMVKEISSYHNSHDKSSPESTSILTDPSSSAKDSTFRLKNIFVDYDLESIYKLIIHEKKLLIDLINRDFKKCEKLTNWIIYINNGKEKNGLPTHKDELDNIYLYTDKTPIVYSELITLSQQINSVSKSIPWLYIYFVPKDNAEDISKLKKELLDTLSTSVAIILRERFNELFNIKVK